MGGPKRLASEELLPRIQAWGDEWRAVAGCTELANCPRAEAAIRSLYAAAGMTEPAICWVPSPMAGILAYSFASQSHAKVISPYIRGEVGTGANRVFRALAEPFGLDPAWTNRLALAVVDQLPPERLRERATWDPIPAAAEAFGLAATRRVAATARAAAAAGARSTHLPAEAPWPEAIDAAARVLGPAWDQLAGLVGLDLARGVIGKAIGRLVEEVLIDPSGQRNAIQAMQPGQWDDVAPVLASARNVFGGHLWRPLDGRAEREGLISARLELARSAGSWWALEGLAIVSERPLLIKLDDRGRPHASSGPAIAWADGSEAHSWHGIQVEPWMVNDPDRITPAIIDLQRNVEVRRVLIERFGEDRLIREGGAKLVHEDETGRLWRRDLNIAAWDQPRDEPICMVEVLNSTPEPDGTSKTYFLRVPPTVQTAHEAVAWTFGLGSVEYQPAMET